MRHHWRWPSVVQGARGKHILCISLPSLSIFQPVSAFALIDIGAMQAMPQLGMKPVPDVARSLFG